MRNFLRVFAVIALIVVIGFTMTTCEGPMGPAGPAGEKGEDGVDGENMNASFVAVTGITGVPDSAAVGIPVFLSGTVTPSNATNKSIMWTISDSGTTGVSYNGVFLNFSAAGTVIVTATIPNGVEARINYTEDFTITVSPYAAVTNISGVPASAYIGTPLTLTGTVEPLNASDKEIAWTVSDSGSTEAAITGNVLSVSSPGTVTVTATIANGTGVGVPYTQNFTLNVPIIAVTDISGVPAFASPGVPITLTGIVIPSNAINKAINWSLSAEDDGSTAAVISGNVFTALTEGTATITATINNGTAPGTNFTKDFEITVAIVPVTNITGVPAKTFVGIPLPLTGTVVPAHATHTSIIWTVQNARTTGADITGNILTTASVGTVTVTATITDGTAPGTDYTQDFDISVVDDGLFFNLTLEPGEDGGLVFNPAPITLSKIDNPVQVIQAPEGSTNVVWDLGLTRIGIGNELTLYASDYNTGTYTLYCTFVLNGKPWMGNIPVTIGG